MRVLFVRHGESHSNAAEAVSLPDAEGDRLTDRGRKQAALAGEALREAGISELISSPMRRARETAELISESIGVAVTTDDGIHELRESRGYGELPAEEQKLRRWSVWMAEHEDPDFSYNGGESFNEVVARVRSFQERLEARDPTGPIAVVSHGIFLRFFFCHSLLGERFTVADVPRLWHLRTANAAISAFEHDERHHPADPELEGWTCLSWMERPAPPLRLP